MGFSLVTMYFCLFLISVMFSTILFVNRRNFNSKVIFWGFVILSMFSSVINVSLFAGNLTPAEKVSITPTSEYARCIRNSSQYAAPYDVIRQCSESVSRYFNTVYKSENQK